MNDMISRQAAIDAMRKALYDYEDKMEKQFQESDELDVAEWIVHRIFVQNMNAIDRKVIMDSPTAQPERKRGKWRIYVDCEGKTRRCTCNLCGHKTDEYCWESPNYCENCGAEMEDGEEEDEEEDWEEDDWDE